ncbi:hypothetical protein RHMOL_Rhmol09G0093100 [Rhododendron molle]|uniref:Uncharacterized protein n=1 Tax=Rhododendron molle TaxID=49168 RepID=A0ACC0MCT9_RHOML|nr:hypothetical protein RHMOL_Rhmol09G0093100 [Rhododendron molle]
MRFHEGAAKYPYSCGGGPLVSCNVPVLYAFRGFFGALPLMENFEVGVKEEEVDGDMDAGEVTKEEYLSSEGNLEKDETPEVEDTK